MDHKPHAQLLEEIEAAKKQIQVGAKYVHYKGPDKLYEVMGFGTLESTDELCVIYKSLYGEPLTFIRPVSVWLEKVEWQGQTLPRFKKVEP